MKTSRSALAALGVAGALAAGTLAVALPAAASPSAHPQQADAPRAVAPHATKRVLFDDTKAETAGNADWIISTSMPDPTKQNANPTKETDWTGALSAWGVALQQTGDYSLETLPTGNSISYGDSGNPLDLSNFDEFVLPEPNIQLSAAEKSALMNFVKNGGGLFLISDHNGSDRNNDGWDSPKIINDLLTNNGVDNNDPFGFSVDLKDIQSDYPVAVSDSSDPVLNGSFGTVSHSEIADGTTFTLHPSDNANVKELLHLSTSAAGDTDATFVTSTYGSGRVAIWNDSSPIDDGTGESGKSLYVGWADPKADDAALGLNATAWLAGNGSAGGGGGTTTTTTPPSGGSCTAGQLLKNPGFESGTAPWTTSQTDVVADETKEPARTGSYDAWLDGRGTTHTDTLSQQVALPSGCSTYQFSYYLHIDTAEPLTTAYDKLSVQVLNSSGAVLGTIGSYSNENAANGYTQHTANLAAYAGQTVTVKFTGTEDSQKQTSFVVDDTALNAS
jgi:hypothetical protein